jgi:flagellar basal body-associated protein FliL
LVRNRIFERIKKTKGAKKMKRKQRNLLIIIYVLVILGLVILLFVRVHGAERKKFVDAKPISGNITAVPAAPGSQAIVTSTVTFNNETGAIIGTLYPDNTFKGDIIETLRVLITKILIMDNENNELNKQNEILKEDFYTLKKLIREGQKK